MYEYRITESDGDGDDKLVACGCGSAFHIASALRSLADEISPPEPVKALGLGDLFAESIKHSLKDQRANRDKELKL